LFELWSGQREETGELTGGRYTLFQVNIVRATKQTFQWNSEEILFDVREKDKWRKEEALMQCAECLYAAK
jgi:hypothetical protein